MKIYGFYHILFINHWAVIVQEQLVILRDSGLYDACEKIYIGCLGNPENLNILKAMLKDYPKLDIHYHSHNHQEYEFATMRLVKEVSEAKGSFYGFYFHTKGVSWPLSKNKRAFIGGNFWRNYLNYYNLKKWKDCVAKLDEGYDTCGVKLLQPHESPARRLHYSGTFFHFKSDYIKRLPRIDDLNTGDRFQAEFWIGTGEPKAATLCQDFIDYHATGTWKDPA